MTNMEKPLTISVPLERRIEKSIHEAVRDLVRIILSEHGVRIHDVHIEWITMYGPSENRLILGPIELKTSSSE